MSSGKKRSKKVDSRKVKLYAEMVKNAKTFWESILKAKLPQTLLIAAGLGVLSGGVMGFILERGALGVSMFGEGRTGWFQRLIDGFYFAIVTMATCGYGDLTPKDSVGRLFAILMIFIGVLCFSMVTATLASIRVVQMIKEGKGIVELSRLNDHTVICGWKKKMDQTLDDIFTVNPDLKAGEIVIIANISQDTIELFRQQNPKFKDIIFLRGEDFNENLLEMANVKSAKRAFILADESAEASLSETDSKTVMTAMTISTIARNVPICAELLDPKFETYLQKAHVAEIIYPRQYGRLMLAQSTVSTGIVQVINDLLDINSPAMINTCRFPAGFIGKPYSELKSHFESESKCVLIGLLENVGGYFERKQEALRQAQKTANISKLVDNLQKVKHLINNQPHFNPPADYIIPDHSMAILIEVRRDVSNG
jgi:voltage-gated potassium channel